MRERHLEIEIESARRMAEEKQVWKLGRDSELRLETSTKITMKVCRAHRNLVPRLTIALLYSPFRSLPPSKMLVGHTGQLRGARR